MVESNPLIAQNSSQFSDQAFWQGFFKESAKQESFEWYSEFEEL
jgi:hypothetical protein